MTVTPFRRPDVEDVPADTPAAPMTDAAKAGDAQAADEAVTTIVLADTPPPPFAIKPAMLMGLCLGSGAVGGVVAVLALVLLGWAPGGGLVGNSAATASALKAAGLPETRILPPASEIRANSMRGVPMRGPWPVDAFAPPLPGEQITSQNAMPRAIGSFDALNTALEGAITAIPNGKAATPADQDAGLATNDLAMPAAMAPAAE